MYLADAPDKIIEMGRNARQSIEEYCNPERYYQKMMNIYKAIL
jgi:hypothetical protein